MLHSNELVASLDALASELSLLKHPFYQEWTAGTLCIERLRNYAAQYYRHVAAFPRYLSGLHSRCEDLETRQILLENLIDEERGCENHPELWMRFAEALGLTREQVMGAQPLPAATALVETFTHLTRDLPLQAGLGALYAYESQIPAVATAKIDGLRRFYGIADEDGVRFFTVHREADPFHAQTVGTLIERYAARPDDRRIVLESGRTALEAVWNMLDSI
jgi:pyrroloquinoline-quinone synthase